VVVIEFILFFEMFYFQVKCVSMGMGTQTRARPLFMI